MSIINIASLDQFFAKWDYRGYQTYWILFCAAHGIECDAEFESNADFTCWINGKHIEYMPGENVCRVSKEYVSAFIEWLKNNIMDTP